MQAGWKAGGDQGGDQGSDQGTTSHIRTREYFTYERVYVRIRSYMFVYVR